MTIQKWENIAPSPFLKGRYLVKIYDCGDIIVRLADYDGDWKLSLLKDDPAWTEDQIVDWAEIPELLLVFEEPEKDYDYNELYFDAEWQY